nr:MAG TPA: hypothetical protein [Caudoviricetes sp.]
MPHFFNRGLPTGHHRLSTGLSTGTRKKAPDNPPRESLGLLRDTHRTPQVIHRLIHRYSKKSPRQSTEGESRAIT